MSDPTKPLDLTTEQVAGIYELVCDLSTHISEQNVILRNERANRDEWMKRALKAEQTVQKLRREKKAK